MNIPKSSDIVVIGGGPAGSMAATCLAQKGYEVVLFDKQTHPRYAVGESLIPDFWTYIDLMGVSERIKAEGFVPKSGGIVNWDGQSQLLSFAEFGYSQAALHVERDCFDHILLSHAQEQGVQVYEGCSVRWVEFVDANPVTASCLVFDGEMEVMITCRYVIDASGQNAVLGRQLGLRKINEAFRFLGIWGYFKGGRYLDKTGTAQPIANYNRIPPTTYVTSLAEFQHVGWCWHILLRDKVSVGLVIPIKSAKSLKAEGVSWETYFQQKCREIPVTSQLLADAEFCAGSVRSTRDFSYRSTQVAGPGYFLIGDAAGFIDPVFSIGVVLGLYTAHAAAWAIDRSMAVPNRAAGYRELFTTQTQGRFELARSLAVPRYEPNLHVDELAKTSMQLASNTARSLMHSAAAVTGRSENFVTMMTGDQMVGDRRLININTLTI